MYLFLEFLTDAYRNACAQGEALTYKGHVVVLGHSNIAKDKFLEGLLDESIRYSFVNPYENHGIKMSLIKSKFNKATHRTEIWTKSWIDSSEVMTELRHAVLSHIRSRQHGDEVKEDMESHSSATEESEQERSSKNKKQDVKLETPEKEFTAQFNKIDNETLSFLHRNLQSQEAQDNNIPYSINLWNYDAPDEFSAKSQLILKPETLILYVMDISLDFLSSFEQSRHERETNETSKILAEMLTNWLSSVYVQAKRQNFEPNIVLLLTHNDSLRETGRSQYMKNYIQTITAMVEGKPYADYISEENILIVDNCEESFQGLRNKLFARMLKLPNWSVPRPIRWLALEADLLRRTANEGQDKYESDLFDFYGRKHISSHYRRKQYLLGESLRQKPVDPLKRTPFVLISKVKELASAYDMDDSEVESFLQFHHTLGDFIYCPPSKGERCIITNPQWLTDRFEELTEHYREWDYISEQKKPRGVVTKEVLHCIWGKSDVQLLIDLMISYGFILPLDNEKQTYLVPYLLQREGIYLHGTELTYSTRVEDVQSPRTFLEFISFCAQETNWKLDGHLSRSKASFDVTKGTHLVLTQMNDTIQISTWTSKQELDKGQIPKHELRTILFDIHKQITRKMEGLGVEQSKNFRILCPHWRPGDEYFCLVEMENKAEAHRPDNILFHHKYDRCAVHNKVLDPCLFFPTDENREGMFKQLILYID